MQSSRRRLTRLPLLYNCHRRSGTRCLVAQMSHQRPCGLVWEQVRRNEEVSGIGVLVCRCVNALAPLCICGPAIVLRAGLLSGAIGIAVANPTDVVKVRLQAELRSTGPRRYKGTIDAYRSIIRYVTLLVPFDKLWVGRRRGEAGPSSGSRWLLYRGGRARSVKAIRTLALALALALALTVAVAGYVDENEYEHEGGATTIAA